MTRHGGVTFPTFIPSPTRCTPTATTSQAPSSSWRAARSAPACTATTQACGASDSPTHATASPSHYVLVQNFHYNCHGFVLFFNSETLLPSSSSRPVMSLSLVLHSNPFAHTWTQEHDLDPSHYHCLEYCRRRCVFFLCVCVSDITLPLVPRRSLYLSTLATQIFS